MHRPDPLLKEFNRGVRTTKGVPNTLQLYADVALATVLNDKYEDVQKAPAVANGFSTHPTKMGKSKAFVSSPGRGGSRAHTFSCEGNVIEPLRMLHQCIRYFASHPEVYGGNIRGLLDRELMYVMRIKASETSLMSGGMVPVMDNPLPPITKMRGGSGRLQHPKLSKCSGWMVTPSSLDAALATGTIVRSEGMFGFGGINFMEATPSFLSLLDNGSRQINLPDTRLPLDEEQKMDKGVDSVSDLLCSSSITELKSKTSEDIGDRINLCDGLQTRPFRSDSKRASNILPTVSSPPACEAGAKILIDGASYEVSFLRNQLQQVEAAYNAKCIRLHELQEENKRQLLKLQDSETDLKWHREKINEMRAQMDSMKRELDAWKQHATELNMRGEGEGSKSSSEMSQRLQAVQLNETKRELTQMSRLWRETEKSLQETRRSLENAEKETQISHKYLQDAFCLIERLERRIERRENFIEAKKRRQASQEEKYAKLMWCLRELQVMKGVQSYADLLLSEDPMWFLFLFVRLQRRFMGFSHLDGSLPSNLPPLYFQWTQGGGRLLDAYSPKLVYRLMIKHVSGQTNIQNFDTREEFRGKIPNWRGLYSIDYFTGAVVVEKENSISLSGSEMTRRNLPVLTLGSVLLPLKNTPVVGDVLVEDDMPNITQYDRGTIRLLLYCFWSERLAQYKQAMQCALRVAKEKDLCARVDVASVKEMMSNEEGEVVNGTSSLPSFLSALVDFAERSFQQESKPVGQTEMDAVSAKLLVRGVVVKNEKLYNGKHMFFSSIVRVGNDGTETPVELSLPARELLYAMYYYAEEYKEVDSDYRLFHLIAHQQIPELVGINFYASMEALRISCDELLCRHLGQRRLDKEKSLEETSTESVPHNKVLKETPIDTLMKAVVVIDTAPLVDENTCIEPDSEGEGFGSILPGRRTSDREKATEHLSERTSALDNCRGLKHDIHEYLFPTDSDATARRDGNDPQKCQEFRTATDVTTSKEEKISEKWVTLNERLGVVLGSHFPFLKAFEKYKIGELSRMQSLERRRFEEESASFSATRGLLPLNEFMGLLHQHCFATYALSCCGGTRSSLIDTMIKSSDYSGANCGLSLDPLTPIGQLPPTETHIRRLRFAISLDQPSTLLRYSDLFFVDSRYGTPSHFHDEYLRVTLDTYLEQQEALMNIILGSAFAPQSVRDDDIALDSDGSLPFPVLRSGMENHFRELLVGLKASNIFAKHFLTYCELMQHKDDIRLEQFNDAPFLFNISSLTEEELEADIASAHDWRWSVEDEAASCSLLHLSLAVRMTYVVWGFNSVRSARLAVMSLPSAAARFAQASISSSGQIDDSIADQMEKNSFLNDVKHEYVNAVRRAKTGMGLQNELRRVALDEVKSRSFSLTRSDVLNPPAVDMDASDNIEADGMFFDPQCLFNHWENQPQRLGVLSAKRKQSKRLNPQKVLESIPGAVDVKYLPAASSLGRFLGIGQENQPTNPGIKKIKLPKGWVNVRKALRDLYLGNEAAWISHQKHFSEALVKAASKRSFEWETMEKEDVPVDDDLHDVTAGINESHDIGTFPSREWEDFQSEQKELLRNAYAGCAALSLI